MTTREITAKDNQTPLMQIEEELNDLKDELYGWQDGTDINDDPSLAVVEDIISRIKALGKDADAGKEAEYRPLKNELDKVQNVWNPLIKKIDGHKRGLLATITRYKNKLAEEQRRKQQAAWEEEQRLKREAQKLEEAANMKNAAEREMVDDSKLEARIAQKERQDIQKEKVKGLRTVRTASVFSYEQFGAWILSQPEGDTLRKELDRIAQGIARRGDKGIPGVTFESKKVAF